MNPEVRDAEEWISRRVRALRLERGLTLEKVAAAADLTASYLSRIESGHRVPSIGTLVLLARALGASVAELTAPPREFDPVVRGAGASRYGSEGAEVAHLSPPSPGAVIEASRVSLHDGATPPRPVRHRGEEWLHVVSGRLHLTLEGRDHVLEAGDAAQFPGSTEHVLRGAPDAEVVVVIATTHD